MTQEMHSSPGFFYSSSNINVEAVPENTNQESTNCMQLLQLKVKEEPTSRDSPNQIDTQHAAPRVKTEEEEIADDGACNIPDEDYMYYLKNLPDDDYLYFLDQIRLDDHSFSADIEVQPEGSVVTVRYEELENGLNSQDGEFKRIQNVGKRQSSWNKQSKHDEANGCPSHQPKKRLMVQEKFIQRKVNGKNCTIQKNTHSNDEDESVSSDGELNMTSDDFTQKLEAALLKPFSPREFQEKWNLISIRKPRTVNRQTRHTSFRVETDQDGLSYLDYYPDLFEKLNETDSQEDKLRLMRGFFHWLRYASWPGSFQPWVSVSERKRSSDGDDDCMEVEGPECELIQEVLDVEDNSNSKYAPKGHRMLQPKIEVVSENMSLEYRPNVPFVPKRVKKEIEV